MGVVTAKSSIEGLVRAFGEERMNGCVFSSPKSNKPFHFDNNEKDYTIQHLNIDADGDCYVTFFEESEKFYLNEMSEYECMRLLTCLHQPCIEKGYTEVRIEFCNEETGKWSVDAWKTIDDNEEGVVVAEIDDETLEITWRDKMAETDKKVIDAIKFFLNEKVDEVVEDCEERGWEVNGWEITDNGIEVELTRMNDKTWTTINKEEVEDDYGIKFDTLAHYLQ